VTGAIDLSNRNTVSTHTDAGQRPPHGSRPAGPPQSPAVPSIDMSARLGRALSRRFRMPGPADPTPRQPRLIGVTLWAAVLGFGALFASLRLIVGLFTNISTSYAVGFIAIGLVGLGATLGAFASVHRQRLPWMLLGVATVALVASWILNANA
jgi:hypothetical protein